jgi:hypothetical protein
MAQHDMNIANQGFPAFRSDLNNALSAIQTNHSGTSRPTGAVAGQIWLDTTSATNPTLKFFDGTDDISLATIDYSANTVNWLDSTVSVTGLATTATGTVLTLTDSVSTSTVNLIIDNQKEIRFRETTANGTNYVALKAPASLGSDVTFTLPSADGTADQVLKTDGSGNLSFTDVSGGISWQSVQTTGFTASAGNAYPCNTTSAGFTVTLPATPSAGNQVQLVDYAGTFDTNKIIIDGNGEDIEGSANNFQLTGEREGVILTYIDSTQGWIATSGINEGTDALAQVPYSVDFLVVAGGGGGGSAINNDTCGGGGGAGGYRNSYSTEPSGGGGGSETSLTFSAGTVYTISIGAGGAGGAGIKVVPSNSGDNGNNSSISGSDITTVTSIGGGGGRAYFSTVGSGGSGGGGTDQSVPYNPAGSGTANQGYDGGAGINSPRSGGGGGGAGEVGNTDGTGHGGDGLSSSITGSAVTRAGGGGGAGNITEPNGGSGGGGTGRDTATSEAGEAGTVNTGGGGGGANYNSSPTSDATAGGNGGSGVIILRMPTSSYSSTTTGSPTVDTDGTDTILTFNASGTYTG